jgi:hypothetical protein
VHIFLRHGYINFRLRRSSMTPATTCMLGCCHDRLWTTRTADRQVALALGILGVHCNDHPSSNQAQPLWHRCSQAVAYRSHRQEVQPQNTPSPRATPSHSNPTSCDRIPKTSSITDLINMCAACVDEKSILPAPSHALQNKVMVDVSMLGP